MRIRRLATVGVLTAAVVAGQTSAVLAAPTSGPAVSIAVVDTLQPVLKAAATAGGSGAQSLKFYARTAGASSWDLIDGQTVAGTSGTAQVSAGLLSVQSRIEYRAEHCDTTGCTTSATKSSLVATGVGIGPRPGTTTASFALGDRISAGLDVGSGNLMVSLPAFTLPRVAGDLSVGLVYNSTSRANLGGHQTSISSGWRLSTGSDVYLAREAGTGAITYYGQPSRPCCVWLSGRCVHLDTRHSSGG